MEKAICHVFVCHHAETTKEEVGYDLWVLCSLLGSGEKGVML